MVSTRSHDHTPTTVGKENAKDDGTDVVTSGKRKRQHDGVAITPSQPSAKRRRAVEELKNDVSPMPQIATAVVVEIKEQDINGMREQELPELEPDIPPQEVKENAARASSRSPPPTSRRSNTHSEEPLVDPASVDVKQEYDPEEASRIDNHDLGQPPVPPNPAKKSKQLKKAETFMKEDDTKEKPTPEPAEEIKTTASPLKPQISTHKRFDSAEPEIKPPQLQPQEKDDVQEASHDNLPNNTNPSDDDEAPETVTASAGQAQALTAALEQSKAATQLEKEKKLKRRERDARLKEQAKAAKRETKTDGPPKSTKAKGIIVEDAVDQDDTSTSESKPQLSGKKKQSLPALLPEHILAAEPDIRPFVPQLASTSHVLVNRKKKFLDLEQKPPKDIKKGGVKIRVLQDEKGILPPKASQQGRALREAWLMGRRGIGNVVERRKMRGQGGFVRR